MEDYRAVASEAMAYALLHRVPTRFVRKYTLTARLEPILYGEIKIDTAVASSFRRTGSPAAV